jgi:hypothetical protein
MNIILKVIAIVFIYLFFLGTTYQDISRTIEMNSWIKTSAQIVTIFILEDKNMQNNVKKYIDTYVNYSYSVKGEKYSNEELISDQKTHQRTVNDEEILHNEKEHYGQKITIWYNPKKPNNVTAIEAKFINAILIWTFIGLFLEFLLFRSLYRQVKLMVESRKNASAKSQ